MERDRVMVDAERVGAKSKELIKYLPRTFALNTGGTGSSNFVDRTLEKVIAATSYPCGYVPIPADKSGQRAIIVWARRRTPSQYKLSSCRPAKPSGLNYPSRGEKPAKALLAYQENCCI
jgi:hypothetical protein